jgi:predicted transcriptional regulator
MVKDSQERARINVYEIIRTIIDLEEKCSVDVLMANIHVKLGIRLDRIVEDYFKPMCTMGLLSFEAKTESICLTEKGKEYLRMHEEG